MKEEKMIYEIGGGIALALGLVLSGGIAIAGLFLAYYKDENYQLVRCIEANRTVEQCKELLK